MQHGGFVTGNVPLLMPACFDLLCIHHSGGCGRFETSRKAPMLRSRVRRSCYTVLKLPGSQEGLLDGRLCLAWTLFFDQASRNEDPLAKADPWAKALAGGLGFSESPPVGGSGRSRTDDYSAAFGCLHDKQSCMHKTSRQGTCCSYPCRSSCYLCRISKTRSQLR